MTRFRLFVVPVLTRVFAARISQAGPTQAPLSPSASAPAKEERVPAIQEELERLRTELEALRAELQRLRVEAAGVEDQDRSRRIAAIEALQAKLEAELVRISAELKQTGDALDQVFEGERKRPTITVYGTLQATKYAARDSILDAEAFEIVLSGRPHPRLSFFAEIEFERTAGVGGPRGGEIVLEQAYASYTFAQFFSVRTGVLLVPFGNVNVDHFAPLRDVVRKPLVSYAIAPSDWTDNGIQVTGRRLLGAAWLLEYEASVVAGLDGHITSVGAREARQAFGVDNNNDKALVGRFAVKRSTSLETGISGYTGRYDDENRRRLKGWAADLRVDVRSLRLTGEFDHFTADRGALEQSHLRGYYVRASYDLRGGWLRSIAKDFDEPRLTLVGQYDWARIDGPNAATGGFERNQETGMTVGLAYRPSRQWVLKVDHETNRARNLALDRGAVKGWVASVGFVF